MGFPDGSAVKPLPANEGDSRDVDSLEKGMETHSSILAWEIPWTEESCGLQSMGSQRVRHDCMTKQQHPAKKSATISQQCLLSSTTCQLSGNGFSTLSFHHLITTIPLTQVSKLSPALYLPVHFLGILLTQIKR